MFQSAECTCTIQNDWNRSRIVILNEWNVSQILLPSFASAMFGSQKIIFGWETDEEVWVSEASDSES